LRSPLHAIEYFHAEVLPTIREPFVLVTGSEDVTVPLQTDVRWPRFDAEQRRQLDRIRRDERVIRWFAENLDSWGTGLTPMPTGIVPPPSDALVPELPSFSEADPRSVLCAHRIRPGAQWSKRRSMSKICRVFGDSNCTVIEHEVPYAQFIDSLQRHAFVLCVEGGGLDPSPKAWTALLHGCIPIVRESPTTDAYRDLPVVFTRSWDERAIEPAWLEEEYDRLRPWFESASGRARLRERLTLRYWWGKVESEIRGAQSGVFAPDH
jgi:hypothetical protein